jgi:hypothetical protein
VHAPPDDVFRVLVTGSQDTTPAQDAYVWSKLDELHAADRALHGNRPMVVVQGHCPTGGVDRAAQRWAERTEGVTGEDHLARWRQLGDRAGPQLNTEMVQAGAHLVLAFPGRFSRDTWDCVRKAVDAYIPPRIYPLHIFCPDEETPR